MKNQQIARRGVTHSNAIGMQFLCNQRGGQRASALHLQRGRASTRKLGNIAPKACLQFQPCRRFIAGIRWKHMVRR
jgi:hypothetical protein